MQYDMHTLNDRRSHSKNRGAHYVREGGREGHVISNTGKGSKGAEGNSTNGKEKKRKGKQQQFKILNSRMVGMKWTQPADLNDQVSSIEKSPQRRKMKRTKHRESRSWR